MLVRDELKHDQLQIHREEAKGSNARNEEDVRLAQLVGVPEGREGGREVKR